MSQTPPDDDKAQRRKRWLTWLKRGATVFFFILIPTLLFNMLRNLEWSEVVQALQGFGAWTLLGAAGIALVSYLVFGGYDLVGRWYTGHRLPVRQIVPLTFVCYAFNLNLGAWVGGIALRFRLYSRLGLDVATITRIFSISLIANWVGYMLLAGTVFSLGMMDLPGDWAIGERGLQFIGFALLGTAAAYLLACQFSRRREWTFREHKIELPSLKMAVIQVALGAINWSLMATLIYLLLPEEAFFPSILGILLVSSIAGVVTHVPAGLGVLEAIFIALLQHQIPVSAILAALIGYRAIYFLLPLGIALVIYLVMEKRAKTMRSNSGPAESDQVDQRSEDGDDGEPLPHQS
jgi:glycosyltransferase 2 family protein